MLLICISWDLQLRFSPLRSLRVSPLRPEFEETAHQRSVLFCRHGVLSWLFEREKSTYAERLVRRLTASLSLTGPEQYIGLDLEFAMYEERCHPLPYVFSHGLSSGGRESYEQLAVASTAGLERLPVLIE